MTAKTIDLAGKVAAITGGARGMGRSLAQAMAAKGMKVAIGDRDYELAVQTATEIGPAVRAYRLDVCDEASFTAFLDDAERDLGPIYTLCNNAGIMLTGMYHEETAAKTKAMIDINVGGVATGCRLILPRLQKRGAGHIVNMGSSASKAGYPGIATYSATKFYVFGLSEALRAEVHGTDIHVTCVMPGIVDTDLSAGITDTKLLKRISPGDVANAIVATLEQPKFELYAPKSVGTMNALMALLPRGLREGLIRSVGADRILMRADPVARASYIERASKDATH